MTIPAETGSGRLSRLPRAAQAFTLIALSATISTLLTLVHLPAALLIGALLSGIVVGVNGASVRVPVPAFGAAQAIIGCLIAASISLATFSAMAQDWSIVLGVVIATLSASSFLGWLISRWGVMPGTTAVWGSTPGAASAMVLMAGAFGADQRLVAFMQYWRVILVTVGAAAVARLWIGPVDTSAQSVVWFPAIQPLAFGVTLASAALGAPLGRLLRLPSPYFLGGFLAAAILHLGFGLPVQLPGWLLAASYALVGWSIGLNFTRPILLHAARSLPLITLSILILMGFCGLIGMAIARVFNVDPLTAYLATSPGGMDSVAIIAAAAHNVDLSFVMALQAARFIVVLLLGPTIARTIARTLR